MKETPVTKPHLFLCGLGIFPPYTATLEVLHALGRCDVLFNNVAGPEVRELLAEFCADVRPASYQAWQDEPRWADAIFAELARGKTVGFVTRGHPLVFGGLARELVRRCRAQGVGHQTFGAVSSIDHLLAVSSLGLGDDVTGMQVMDMPALVEGQTLNVRQPLLATFYYGIEKRSQAEAVQRALERSYPPGHECLMYGPKYDAPPAVVAVGDFARRYPTLHSSLMLYLPPLADGGDQSRPRGSKAALRARARRPAAKGLGARG